MRMLYIICRRAEHSLPSEIFPNLKNLFQKLCAKFVHILEHMRTIKYVPILKVKKVKVQINYSVLFLRLSGSE